MKKTTYLLLFATLLTAACSQQRQPQRVAKPQHEVLLKTTPVKNQGSSALCWAYAMLATIETEHLMKGDSVNLSADYVARCMLEEQARRYYLSGGRTPFSLRGMMPMLVSRIRQAGLLSFNSYHVDSTTDFNMVQRKLQRAADIAIGRRTGLQAFMEQTADMLDEHLRPAPRYQFMFGAEYTAAEFGRSVCSANEYVALTSVAHHPFGKPCVLEIADNQDADSFLNVPMKTLTQAVVKALRRHHPVCWEGDISEPGFSFSRGVAQLSQKQNPQQRQRMIESFATTDDHCMELIGLARSSKGKTYFICKNSWGTNNPFGGLMYMSEDYFYYKTIAVMMSRDAWEADE